MGEGVPTNPKKGFALELKAARDAWDSTIQQERTGRNCSRSE
jgi:hypothetical protein